MAWYCKFELPGAEKLNFTDICHTLTELHLSYNTDLTSDNLERFATLCPNLCCLELQGCQKVLSDLKDIARGCPKLKNLNIISSFMDMEVEGLWKILASMFNLRILYLSETHILQEPDLLPTPLPNLTALYVEGDYRCEEKRWKNFKMGFLTKFTSLEVVSFEGLQCSAKVPDILRALTRLTHFFIRGIAYLPTDYSCYAHLRQLFLYDRNHMQCVRGAGGYPDPVQALNYTGTGGAAYFSPEHLTSVKSLLLFYICMVFEGKRTQKSNRKALCLPSHLLRSLS